MSDVKVITEPSVYLLGKQVVQNSEMSRFLADHGISWESDSDEPAEVLTETAGRVCYMSFQRPRPGGNSAYLNHIKEVSHGSVLEHGVWNLLLTGISRSLTHELIRHRAGWAYSQLSQRYVDESDVAFVVPHAKKKWYDAWQSRLNNPIEKVCGEHDKHASYFLDWMNDRRQDLRRYSRDLERLIEEAPDTLKGTERRKWARQAARDGLPNCTETKIFVTANARALRHFLEQRGSQHAEPEIRKLANSILDVLVKDTPNLFGDYRRTELPDGTFEITTDYPKV